MSEIKTTTEKMQNETLQQYTAWLLYCEAGSIDKMLKKWESLHQNITKTSPELEGLAENLGKPIARRNIIEWSKKYRWVERRELKLAEDIQTLREKTKKIKREKLHRIADAFEKIGIKIAKRLRGNEEPTILEWKIVWEMFQVELGKPTSRSQLKVEEQRPLTPEEKEYGKKLHEAVKEIVRKQHRGKQE